jgi:hypothetical protein
MRAPVFRDIESKETLFGLAFPSEVLLVVAVAYGGVSFIEDGRVTLAMTVATYVGLRAATHGKPPGHLMHWLAWQWRRLHGGRLCAATRARQPSFPHSRGRA